MLVGQNQPTIEWKIQEVDSSHFLDSILKDDGHPTMQKYKSLMILSTLGHFWDTKEHLVLPAFG